MTLSEKQDHAAQSMLYLCGCVITETKPKADRLTSIDLKMLYAFSQFQTLSALVCEGLEQAEYKPTEEMLPYMKAFREEKDRSVRKNILLDMERAKILSFMEQNSIWYMPLKGVILKEMYPKMGLRQMADNDILFDEHYRETLRNQFTAQGYRIKTYGIGNHDVYLKDPIYNYEMHVSLYGELTNTNWSKYYKTVKARLVKDKENAYGYHFTNEDFYIYFLSHGFKHFDQSGTGLRFLLDLYIYLKKKQAEMDFDYIEKELRILDLQDFEKNCRELTFEIFSDIHAFSFHKLSHEHQALLTYFLTSGTYGTERQNVQNGVSKKGKFKHLLERIFPGTPLLKIYHPIFRHKFLMPLGWLYRGMILLFDRPKKVFRELKMILRAKKK